MKADKYLQQEKKKKSSFIVIHSAGHVIKASHMVSRQTLYSGQNNVMTHRREYKVIYLWLEWDIRMNVSKTAYKPETPPPPVS